jgi:peptidyl-prolyl cis-trans isomerase D
MALIGTIRKNSWFLVVVIGLALAAFVIMDMTSSANRGGGDQFTLAEVNGQKLDWREFQNIESILYRNSGGDIYGQREYLWNYFVERALVDEEADKLGLGVSKPELKELQFGSNLSPIIVQRFQNPNTGVVDRNLLNNYRQQIESGQLDPQTRQFWAVQEREIIKDRTQTKINTMVNKGLYTPTWMAEMASDNQSQQVVVDLVKVPYAEIDDAEIEVTTADLEKYIKDHREKYELREETRTVAYVSFPVEATKQDSIDIKVRIAELKSAFRNTQDDSLFVQNNFGSFDVSYRKADELTLTVADTVFNAPVGSVIGPYIDENQYRLVKVVDKMIVPDSVESRHILRQVRTQQEAVSASRLLDSLKTEIEAGNLTFEDAASVYGTDNTRTTGGDLGYSAPGRMVKPFNDYIFYQGDIGKLGIIGTQFGLHLVEVTDKKYLTNEEAVRLAIIGEDIIPSEETQDLAYEDALEFVGENRDLETLEASANDNPDISLTTTRPLRKNDYNISGLGANATSRDVIRWAFAPDSRVGDVSPEVYVYKHPTLFYNDRLVIAALSSVSNGELPSAESVKNQVEPLVINEKKAEILRPRLEGKSLTAIAAEFGVEVQSDVNVTFNNNFITGAGNEPKVVGAAAALDQGETSDVIEGTGGLYVIQVTSKTGPQPVSNLAFLKRTAKVGKVNQLNLNLWDAVKENAVIDDNRYRFY